MASDQKITELSELSAPAAGDLLVIVDDPSGSPETKKMPVSVLDSRYIRVVGGTMTGALVLAPGTAILAPIKFQPGVALATPVAGVLEFHDDRLYITNVAVRRAIDRTSDVIVATTRVTNTTDETTIWTGTLGIDALKVGNVLKVNCSGLISTASASDDITLRMYMGTTEITSFNPAIGNVTDERWILESTITVRTVGAAGAIAFQGETTIAGAVTDYASSIETIDTTAAQDITVTVEWDNAKEGNIMDIYQGFLELKN